MLGASINYPLRGAVTWKSIVGTNVAADALSNLSSPGVIGGAMIIIGEDYGEGASVIQERSYAYALKSSMWLLDPRPDLPSIVRMVEKGFELSEASHAPVMLELRIRACHATGEFAAKDNRKGVVSGLNKLAGPPRFDYARLAHPPVTFTQEKLKVEERLPAARDFIREHKLNEIIAGDLDDIGIIVMGGLDQLACCARSSAWASPTCSAPRACRCWCSTSSIRWCRRKSANSAPANAPCWWSRKAHPDYIEQAVNVELRRADIQTKVLGKGPLPQAGEYTSDVLLEGLAAFLQAAQARRHRRRHRRGEGARPDRAQGQSRRRARARCRRGRPPSAPAARSGRCSPRIKLMQRELGPDAYQRRYRLPFVRDLRAVLASAIRSSATACRSPAPRRWRRTWRSAPIAIMGDGGFWHNGLITGVASNLFNKGDGVLIVMQNGYASATGQQYIPSSTDEPRRRRRPASTSRQTLRADGRQMAAHGAHLWRRQDGQDAEGGDAAPPSAASRSSSPTANASSRASAACAPRTPSSSSAASASPARATASTTKSAPATIPASACPAARR